MAPFFYRMPSQRPAWARYGVAFGGVALGWLLRQSLVGVLGPTALPFIFFFPLILLVAWYGGLGPGLLAIFLSAIVAARFFLGPQYDWPRLLSLAIFLVAAGAIVGALETTHRARADLLRSRDLFSTTLASIGDGVIVADTGGRVTFLNREAERLTKWHALEAVGQPLSVVFRVMDERTRRPVEDPVEKVLRTKAPVGLANHSLLVARDGREIPIDDSGAPVREPDGPIVGVVLVFRDAREQRKALAVSARLATIVESSDDVIVSKDLEGRVLTWNPAAERMFGYRADEMIGQSILKLVPPEFHSQEFEILERIRQGRPYERFETVRLTKDGRRIPVSLSISPIMDPEGRVIGASKILHDISAELAARETLAREKEMLRTTLASIGDAVIVTDPAGRVTFLNPEARRLTRWSNEEARGQELQRVFKIIDADTRRPAENPVEKVLRSGTVVGLANPTILVARDGTETPIDDSAAPIRERDGPLYGVVLVFRDFTGPKKAQEGLAKYARMLDAGFDAVILRDARDRIVRWNRGAADLYGWTAEEALGRKPSELLKAEYPRPIEEMQVELHREGRWEGEIEHVRKDGRRLTVLSRWVLDRDEILQTDMDVTERAKAEERFRLAIESAPSAMVMMSRDGRIVLVNQQAEKLFGYLRQEMLGQPIELLVPERFRAAHPGFRKDFFATPRTRPMGIGRDLFGLRKDGTEVPIEIGLNPIRTDEGDYVLAAIVDITERKRAQDEILRLNTDLERRVTRRTHQLEETVQELETFSYTVAHDLRAPLRTMHRSAEVLLDEENPRLSEEGKGFLRRIAEGAERMDRLIQDLLSYSRVARSELRSVPVEPRTILADLMAQLSTEIRERKADVRIETPLPRVLADPVLLAQVFSNLLSNALKFVPAGTPPRVRIHAERRDGMARIWIDDNGIGIDPRFQERLFRIFERLDSAYPGTGIGLAIVKRAVERMGGAVGLEPGRDGGSRFWIELPPAERP